jgi:pimeloyl-ACP methyl ester carboxylesterase
MSTVNLIDQLAATFVMLITPEYAKVKAARQVSSQRKPPRQAPLSMQPAYQKIDGVNIRFAKCGNPNGETILFLSPLPQSIFAFDPIWQLLSQDFNLFAIDIPGFGRSDGGKQFMTFAGQREFFPKMIAALDIPPCHIVGPDVGMPVALLYALDHPEKVKSLLIGDGPALATGKNGSVINKMVYSGFWRSILSVSAGAFVEAGNRLGYVNYSPSAEEVEDYVASYQGRVGMIARWFANYPQSLALLSPQLENLEVPVQIFWGDLDQFLLAENAGELGQVLRRSQVKVFENCGHYSYQDQAIEFAEMVKTWIMSGYMGRTD